jgi:hypothetical protein
MKYFIDTHDKNKGSFPAQELTEEQFFEQFAALEEAAQELGVFGHAAHVNLKDGKAYCFMSGPGRGMHSQGACSDQSSVRLHHRGETRDRRRHAHPTTRGSAKAQGGVAQLGRSTGASLIGRSRLL